MKQGTRGYERLTWSKQQRHIHLQQFNLQLKELYGQALRNLQKKDEQAEESRCQLKEITENHCDQEEIAKEMHAVCLLLEESLGTFREQVVHIQNAGELKCHCIVETENPSGKLAKPGNGSVEHISRTGRTMRDVSTQK